MFFLVSGIRTPHRQGSRRKGKQSQEETRSTKKLFNMIWKIWALGCLSHFASSSFLWGFPSNSLVNLGCFLIVFGNKLEKPQAESCPDGKKVIPILCFVLKWISALHLVLLPRKILSDTLKPVETIHKGQLHQFGWVIGWILCGYRSWSICLGQELNEFNLTGLMVLELSLQIGMHG